MSKIQKQSAIVKSNVQDYLNTTSAYAKYLNQSSPCFVILFDIMSEATKEDSSLETVHSLTGANSPIKYRQITDFPIYGISGLDVATQLTQRGFETDINGDFYMIPDTKVRPVANDFFIIEYNNIDHAIFQITHAEPDRIANGKFWKCTYKLWKENSSIIYDNVGEKCVMTQDSDGNYTVITTDQEAEAAKTTALTNAMVDTYRKLFYDDEMDLFVFHSGDLDSQTGLPKTYFSPYVMHFAYKTKCLTEDDEGFMEEIYVADYNMYNHPSVYSEKAYRDSIYYAVELRDSSGLSFASTFASISSMDLNKPMDMPFFTTSSPYYLVDLCGADPQFWFTAFHMILKDQNDELEDIPSYRKYVDPSELNNTEVQEELSIGDVLYRFAESDKTVPTEAHLIVEASGGEANLLAADIQSMLSNTSSYESDDLLLFDVIRSYFSKTLTVNDALRAKLNSHFYERTLSDYLLMPLAIYALKNA